MSAIKEEACESRRFSFLAREGLYERAGIEPARPQPLSKAQQYFDACKLAAEYRGISMEQFFKEEPGRYKQYCRLVLEE